MQRIHKTRINCSNNRATNMIIKAYKRSLVCNQGESHLQQQLLPSKLTKNSQMSKIILSTISNPKSIRVRERERECIKGRQSTGKLMLALCSQI